MFGKGPFGKTVYGTSFRDINFVPLQSASFCVQCELISTNSTPRCLACGSTSVLGLSRVLGGSLLRDQTAHLITDSELNSLVRDLLRTVPDPVADSIDHARHAVAGVAYPASRGQCGASCVRIQSRSSRGRN